MSSFTPSGSGGLPPQPVQLSGKTTPIFSTVSLISSGTEYEVELPVGTKSYRIRLVQGSSELSVSYVSGQPGETIPKYCYVAESGLLLTSPLSLYLSCSTPAVVAEVLIWT